MKYALVAAIAVLFLASSCGLNNTASTSLTDTASAPSTTEIGKGLYVTMRICDTIRTGQPLELLFMVKNTTDTTIRFLKWDTPFEPLVSKYLDIVDAKGHQMDYRGAMAKKMMPPPAESYITVPPGDSLSAVVNLLDAYAITEPSQYTLVYVGGNMSGLVARDSVTFVYGP